MSAERPSIMDLAEAWAALVKQTFPEHAGHTVRMDDKGTWCETCDLVLVAPSS